MASFLRGVAAVIPSTGEEWLVLEEQEPEQSKTGLALRSPAVAALSRAGSAPQLREWKPRGTAESGSVAVECMLYPKEATTVASEALGSQRTYALPVQASVGQFRGSPRPHPFFGGACPRSSAELWCGVGASWAGGMVAL